MTTTHGSTTFTTEGDQVTITRHDQPECTVPYNDVKEWFWEQLWLHSPVNPANTKGDEEEAPEPHPFDRFGGERTKLDDCVIKAPLFTSKQPGPQRDMDMIVAQYTANLVRRGLNGLKGIQEFAKSIGDRSKPQGQEA